MKLEPYFKLATEAYKILPTLDELGETIFKMLTNNKMDKKIKICTCHDEEVPLIWTFAFRGAEYWCPACGFQGGMLESGTDVPATMALKRSLIEWKEKTKEYLSAVSTFACSELEHEGKRMKPSELPEDFKQKQREIIANFKYEIE